MAAFSKFAKSDELELESNVNCKTRNSVKGVDVDVALNFRFADYFNNKINLSEIKLADLKKIAKPLKIKITTTKPVLIERIKIYLEQWKKTSKIQSVFRGYLVRVLLKLHGPALNNRNSCINATDFCTLEPLNEIPHHQFYSYNDDSGFVYGFDIFSMITIFKNNNTNSNSNSHLNANTVLNPYNRKPICEHLYYAKNMFRFLRISRIVYFDKYAKNGNLLVLYTNLGQLSDYIASYTIRFMNTNTRQRQSNQISEHIVITRLARQRSPALNTRINELFMEIDNCGNYTESRWFSDLNATGYIHLIRSISRILHGIQYEFRRNICPFYNPLVFETDTYSIESQSQSNNIENAEEDTAKILCLTILENIVFGTTDIEYKKIGIMHVLTALTIVSGPARRSIPWLYESVNL
jgi:hypothetical protein